MKKQILIIVFLIASNMANSQVWQKALDASGFPSIKLSQSSKYIYNLSSLKDAVYIQRSDNFGSSWMNFDTIPGSEAGVSISLDMVIKDTLIYVLCELHPKTLSLLILGESGKYFTEHKIAENTSPNIKTDHLFFINKDLWVSSSNGLYKYESKKKPITLISNESCKDLFLYSGKLYKITADGFKISTSNDKGKTWKDIGSGLPENTEYLQLFKFAKELSVISNTGIWLLKADKWEKNENLAFSPQNVITEGKMLFMYTNDKLGLGEIKIYSDNGAKYIRTLSVPPGFVIQHMLYFKESLLALVDWMCYRIKLPETK